MRVLQQTAPIAMVGRAARLQSCLIFHSPGWSYRCFDKSGIIPQYLQNADDLVVQTLHLIICDEKLHELNFIDQQTPSLNVITEFIIGYLYPGYPVANMCFKVYGYISMKQAITFLQDFKLGHYMKIPPREMFTAQVSFPPSLFSPTE